MPKLIIKVVFLFRDKSVVNLVFLVLLFLGIHWAIFLLPPLPTTDPANGFLGTGIHRVTQAWTGAILTPLFLLAVVLQAVRLNVVFNEWKLFVGAGYTVSLAYVLLSGTLMVFFYHSPALWYNFGLLWQLERLVKLYNDPKPKTLLFNLGWVSGLLFLAYHPALVFLPVLFLALGILRPFRLQEWLMLLLGLFLPVYFLFSWYFLTDQWTAINGLLPQFDLGLPAQWLSPAQWVAVGLMGLSFLVGFVYWQQFNGRATIQIRKTWGVLFLTTWVAFLAPFLFAQHGLETAWLALLPLSVFVSNVFSFPRRLWLPNLFFWLFVALAIWQNWLWLKK
ncbi:MAG: hypothetical protein EAZ62_01455 [Sphingobacteriia bacterium]|nr:MAG: hypothetical protein EAZ62_01455 [Sphingobacteriia bacterium]